MNLDLLAVSDPQPIAASGFAQSEKARAVMKDVNCSASVKKSIKHAKVGALCAGSKDRERDPVRSLSLLLKRVGFVELV